MHGEYTSRHICGSVWSRCPTCSAEAEALRRAEQELADRKAAMDRFEQRLGRAGIPERFRTRTLDTFVTTTAKEAHALRVARDYANSITDNISIGKCLVFIGRPGTGKTHLAIGIGLVAMGAGYTVLFASVAEAFRRVRATYGKGATESESEAISALVEVGMLILDEVGVQFGTDNEKNLLFDIINGRYGAKRPTILISNLDLKGVTSYVGVRGMDRLREDGGEAVVFDWDSYRGRQAQATKD
jgi:DNA replication protein DnaC